MSIDQLRELAQFSSAEHARRHVRGISVPTDATLKVLCSHFGWDFAEMRLVAIRDRLRKDYKDDLDLARGIHPASQKFALSWPLLTDEQRASLSDILLAYLKENGAGRLTNTAKAS